MNAEKERATAEEGRRAAKLLEDLAPYLKAIEDELLRVWRTEAKTTDLREEAWHRIRALEHISQRLTTAVQNGQYAERLLNQS